MNGVDQGSSFQMHAGSAMPKTGSRSKEIVPLTSIRGVAALWVVVFHMYNILVYRHLIQPSTTIVQNLLLGGANFAVDIFFILSGYILAENYGTISNPGNFFSHRVARVLPLHVVVLSVMAVGIWAMQKLGIHPESEEFFSW